MRFFDQRYEYIRIEIDMGDLTKLNSLSSVGWRVVGVVQEKRVTQYMGTPTWANFALLERPLP
jgi:hypothetical protein